MQRVDTIVRRFADRLHYLRTERKLTQNELALRSKLSLSFISTLETGRKIPSLVTLEMIARGLSVELRTLVDFPEASPARQDRVHEELRLLDERLGKCKPEQIRKIRRAVECLLS